MNILVCWELGGGYGHAVPLKVLANELVRQGGVVTIASNHSETIDTVFSGMNTEIILSPTLPLSRGTDSSSVFADVLLTAGFDNPSNFRRIVNDWRRLIHGKRFEAILHDHSPFALVASRGYNARRYTIGTGFCCPPNSDVQPNWRPWLNEHPSRFVASESEVCRSITEGLLGADRISSIGQLYEEVDGCFLMTYAELDHFPVRSDPRYRGILPNSPGLIVKWPEVGNGRLLCYLKHTEGTGELLARVASVGMSTLVVIPGAASNWYDQLRAEYPNVAVINEPLDLDIMLPQCDLLLHNGTHGFTAAGLLAGKPAVVFPVVLEQRITCVNLHQMGAGLMVNPVHQGAIERALGEVHTSPIYTAQAQVFAKKYSDLNQEAELMDISATILGK